MWPYFISMSEVNWNFIGIDRNFTRPLLATLLLRYCYVIAELLLRYCYVIGLRSGLDRGCPLPDLRSAHLLPRAFRSKLVPKDSQFGMNAGGVLFYWLPDLYIAKIPV